MPRRLFSIKVRDNIIFDISHVLVARKATLHKNYPLPKFWLNFQVTTSPVLGVSPHPLPAYSRHFCAIFGSRSLLVNRTGETLATQANQALSSLANAGFQNWGVCLASVSSLALPLPPLSFFGSRFISRGSKPKIPFAGLSVLCSKTKRKRLLRRLVVLFFRTEYSKQKFVFHYFRAIFRFPDWFVHGKRDSRTKFTSPEFCVPFA